eukprot:TRINITY_DN4836_c0_g1_i1.p1 TRINITY_DN4836_c0_g1~~TRINITY_DN4836_c0_g1_i1.p1  ORF type:complete len:216 (+),score=42.34 TRINITY_DN4836_c0_g1_i1:38-649(+)
MGSVIGKISEESPKFKVLFRNTSKSYEIRRYPSFLVAGVRYKEKDNEGFNILANYIFGNNVSRKSSGAEKIAMTVPVTIENEKIDMTVPVTIKKEDEFKYMSFVMPSQFTKETLPKPNNSNIEIKEVEPFTVAVTTFSGRATEASINQHKENLLKHLLEDNISVLGDPYTAFYNPPWTLPWLRKNEVMVKVEYNEEVKTEGSA